MFYTPIAGTETMYSNAYNSMNKAGITPLSIQFVRDPEGRTGAAVETPYQVERVIYPTSPDGRLESPDPLDYVW